MRRPFLLIALVCAGAAASAADVYKWTDKDGIVHYSDQEPPAGIKSEKVHVASAAKPAAAAANDADEAATPPSAAPPGVLATATQIAQKRCEQARANLAVLRGNTAVGLDDGSGKALDDKARADRVAREQSTIEQYCR